MRRFRLRNSMVVEAVKESRVIHGWHEDYTIIAGGVEGYLNGAIICLVCQEKGNPKGYHHGSGFDIVEEVA